jgi:hypothetical protein
LERVRGRSATCSITSLASAPRNGARSCRRRPPPKRGRPHDAQSRLLAAAAGDDVELRLVPSANGWVDVDAVAVEAAQAKAEAERRAAEQARRRAARIEQLPELERQERDEAAHWRPANLLPESTP